MHSDVYTFTIVLQLVGNETNWLDLKVFRLKIVAQRQSRRRATALLRMLPFGHNLKGFVVVVSVVGPTAKPC